MDLTAEQIQFLAYTVLGEARGEGPEGMLGVANVIANRVDSGLYADNPIDVVTQRRQFTATEDGQMQAAQREAPVGSALYNTAEGIVRGAIVNRNLPDITGRAINYHTTTISPYWAAGATTRWGTVDVGNHRYYARQPVPPLNIPDVLSLIDTGGVRRAPAPLARPADRSFGNRGDVRLAETVKRVNDQRRQTIATSTLATLGDRGEAAMSMTSRLGSRADFSDSVGAPRLVDYAAGRDTFSLAGLLDRRISMTAPNPPPSAASVSRQVLGNGVQRTMVRADAVVDGKAGARADVAVTASPGDKTRTADSGLVTYVRKVYQVDGYGRPIVDAPAVVKPAAKPSPTWRVQDAITKSKAAISSAATAPGVTAKAAWDAASQKPVTATGVGKGATSVMKSAADVLNASQIKVSGGASGGSAPMRAAAANVSMRTLKLQPAGSVTPKINTARLPAGDAPFVLPAWTKGSPAPAGNKPLPAPAPLVFAPIPIPAAKPIVAPTPLPRIRRFGEGTIPANVKGDPVDFKKLADGVAAEGRRLSGEPALPRPRPAAGAAPVQPLPGKVKLSGVPDVVPQGPQGRGSAKPGPVSTATLKPVTKIISPAVPARRPDSKPATEASRKPIVIEVVGGRRTASPRLVPPQLPNAGGLQSYSAPAGAPVSSNAWQESAFQWTDNTGLPSAISGSSRWNTGY
jgi:hypothetical protein